VYALLRDRYGFAAEDMMLLVDEPERAIGPDGARLPTEPGVPDRRTVLRAIEGFGERVPDPDPERPTQFVFYYAGHGERAGPADQVGWLVLTGYREDHDSARDERGYDMAHLASDVRRKTGCDHHLLLVDCCFSGFTVHKRGDPTQDPTEVYELWRKPALAVITAGTEEERAYEYDDASVFTSLLLEALDGVPPERRPLADGYRRGGRSSRECCDGIVTDAELGIFLHEVLPQRRRNSGRMRQTPQYLRGLEGDDVGQFLFLPRAR
jgi:hypothetical protein